MDRRQFMRVTGLSGLGAVVLGPNLAFAQSNITQRFLNKIKGHSLLYDRPEASGYETYVGSCSNQVSYWVPFRAETWSNDPQVVKNEPLVLEAMGYGSNFPTGVVIERFEDTDLDGRVDKYSIGDGLSPSKFPLTEIGSSPSKGVYLEGEPNMNKLAVATRRHAQSRFEEGLRALIAETDNRLAKYRRK